MSFDNLLLERDGAVAILTINRPQILNALNTQALDELRRAVLARRLAVELSTKAPIAVQYIIEAVNRGLDVSFDKAQFLEATLFGLIASTDDMREGATAFLEKRKAEFKGQ